MKNQKEITSPTKAIRSYCLTCGGSYKSVRWCLAKDCPLYPFRFGKNPFRAGRKMTEEQKTEAAERLKKARESKRV